MCSRWNILRFFKCFYCCWPCLTSFFVKIFQARASHIFMIKWNARQAIGSILPLTITSSWKLFKQNKLKRFLSFREVKFFGWFWHIGNSRIQFRITYVWHGFILSTIYKYIIWMKVLLQKKLNGFCLGTLSFFSF